MTDDIMQVKKPPYGYILSIILVAAVLLAQVPVIWAQWQTLQRMAYVGFEDDLIYSRATDQTNIVSPTLLPLLLFLGGIVVAIAVYQKRVAWLCILGIIAQIFLYGMWFLPSLLSIGLNPLFHLDSVDYNHHTFNLAYTNNNEHGFSYYLFECVGSDTPCHKIAAFGPNTESKLLVSSFDDGKSAELYLDTDNNTLNVELEGTILYQYNLAP